MNKSQEILRKTAKFLYCVAEGAPTELKDFKTFSDLCWLAIPMKYRMDKEEIDEIKSHPWKTCRDANEDNQPKGADFL